MCPPTCIPNFSSRWLFDIFWPETLWTKSYLGIILQLLRVKMLIFDLSLHWKLFCSQLQFRIIFWFPISCVSMMFFFFLSIPLMLNWHVFAILSQTLLRTVPILRNSLAEHIDFRLQIAHNEWDQTLKFIQGWARNTVFLYCHKTLQCTCYTG